MIINPRPKDIGRQGRVMLRMWKAMHRVAKPGIRSIFESERSAAVSAAKSGASPSRVAYSVYETGRPLWVKFLRRYWYQTAVAFGSMFFSEARWYRGQVRAENPEKDKVNIDAIIAAMAAGLLLSPGDEGLTGAVTPGNIGMFQDDLTLFIDRNVNQRATRISETSSNMAKEGMSALASQNLFGLNQGEEVAAFLSGTFGPRLAAISETEAHTAGEFGLFAAALAMFGASSVEKQWNAILDANTRKDHWNADEQRQPIGEAFTIGNSAMMYPGDPSAPPEQTVNCRCFLTYHIL